jgi:hypothetical protein
MVGTPEICSQLLFDRFASFYRSRMFVGDAMKAAHAIIAWTPMHAVGLPKRGLALVGEWIPRRAPSWALDYANLGGATTPARRSLAEADALKALGRDFNELRADGIPASVINEAFAVIDGWQPR